MECWSRRGPQGRRLALLCSRKPAAATQLEPGGWRETAGCAEAGLQEGPAAGPSWPAGPGWRSSEHLESIMCFDQSMFKGQTKPQ